MSWSIVATSIVALFAAGVTCLPMDVPATDLTPPKFGSEAALGTDLMPSKSENENGSAADNGPTLATDLVPPASPEEINEKKIPAMLLVINVIAVKNHTAEDSNDVLHRDVIEEVPSEVAVPLALFLLVLEDENENHPVSLDDVAKDLTKEGFAVEKVVKDGETRMVKVDLDTVETTVRIPEGSNDINNMLEHKTDIQEYGKLTSVRRKRHVCLHCKLEELKEKIHSKHSGGYGGGGGCGGGCGGGGSYIQPVYQPVQPIYQPVQPVYQPVQPVYQPVQPVYQQPKPQYYPQPQSTCNTCQGGGGGGYGQGGGNAYAQASAQASASASSGSYGGYGR